MKLFISKMQSPKPPLIIVVGPTAVGKTALAIDLAERFNGEIISADSRLFYRGLDVGTAKPTISERRGIPHHLIDIVEPDETLSLSVFQSLARQVIGEIINRFRLPFLVGGTGQYIRAVIEDWQVPQLAPDLQMRQAIHEWGKMIGGEELHRKLSRLDPAAAEKIDWRNLRRTVRAWEVILRTGRRFSDQRLKGESPYALTIIGLKRPRVELYKRIDARIDAMIAGGLIEEVRSLLAKGYSPELPSLSAIGYREIITYLQGQITLDEAVIRIKRATRIFVRRQSNWFKGNDPAIHWYENRPGILDLIEQEILSLK